MKQLLAVACFFSLFISSDIFAAEDKCAWDCSPECQKAVVAAEEALISHRVVCRGQDPKLENPVCARSCSKGCKAVMRGQAGIVVDHYELCGGGDGSMGRLQCVKAAGSYSIANSHTGLTIGQSYTFESQCLESLRTQEGNVFCGKSHGGYIVLSTVGDVVGSASSFLNQCVETLMTIRNERICVRESQQGYAIYDLGTFKRVSPIYSFLSACKRHL